MNLNMQTSSPTRIAALFPFISLLLILAAGIFLLEKYLIRWGVDVRVLHAANVLLFAVTALASIWMSRSLRAAGGQALLKALYGGFMIRFFILASVAFAYIISQRKQVNLPGLIGAAVFYILYLSVEVRSLQPVLKSGKQHA